MIAFPLIPEGVRAQLRANAARVEEPDLVPVLKLFNPVGPGRWLLTELAADGDTLFGLCDLDMGFLELGCVSLAELKAMRLPDGLRIERDLYFVGRVPLSMWAILASRMGSVRAAEAMVRLMAGPGAKPS